MMIARLIVLIAVAVFLIGNVASPRATGGEVIRLIYDTDMGNDVDDALALGVIHALADRGECELLAVTITKDQALCAPYVDVVNTFYGRGDTPIGAVRNGPTPDDSRFLPLAKQTDAGRLRYPHDLHTQSDAEEATVLLRRILAGQPDGSVTIVQVGFSTNLARLLNSPPDRYSSLNGRELAQKKVALLSVMAGAFELIEGKRHREYNVAIDAVSARELAAKWPTPIIYSGYEIGYAIRYPAISIDQDFSYVAHHPLAEAYQLYKPTPHERPCWDLTSVLVAVRPERGYFNLSPRGHVVVEDGGFTRFEEDANGSHRYLLATNEQIVRTREALVQLASQPPGAGAPSRRRAALSVN